MSEREDLTFPSGEDTCAAWLYRPDGAAGPVPCVVMAHGFTATRGDRLPAYAERFAAAGLAVLLFDYRHFGDSTGTPRQLLDIGRQQADYRAAVAFARTLDGHRRAADRALRHVVLGRPRRRGGGAGPLDRRRRLAVPVRRRPRRAARGAPARRAARHRARPCRPGRGAGRPRAAHDAGRRRARVVRGHDRPRRAARLRGDRPAGLALAQRGGRAHHAARRDLPARALRRLGRLPAARLRVRARPDHAARAPRSRWASARRAARSCAIRSGTSRSTSASRSSRPSPPRRPSCSATWPRGAGARPWPEVSTSGHSRPAQLVLRCPDGALRPAGQPRVLDPLPTSPSRWGREFAPVRAARAEAALDELAAWRAGARHDDPAGQLDALAELTAAHLEAVVLSSAIDDLLLDRVAADGPGHPLLLAIACVGGRAPRRAARRHRRGRRRRLRRSPRARRPAARRSRARRPARRAHAASRPCRGSAATRWRRGSSTASASAPSGSATLRWALRAAELRLALPFDGADARAPGGRAAPRPRAAELVA